MLDGYKQFNEEAKSPFVKKHKTIIHPGEVNRIRELPQNSKIVATHTDRPEAYNRISCLLNCLIASRCSFGMWRPSQIGHPLWELFIPDQIWF
jgi:hypothetical protein